MPQKGERPTEYVHLKDLVDTARALEIEDDEKKRLLLLLITNVWARMVSHTRGSKHSSKAAAAEALTRRRVWQYLDDPQVLFERPFNKRRWEAFKRVAEIYLTTE